MGLIMSKYAGFASRAFTGGVLAVLVAYSDIASCAVSSAATLAAIADVAAACAAEPMRGTVYYYCDCGTGAAANCVPGDDANAGTAPTAPRRTIEDAVARFGSMPANGTVALCQGGAFNATQTLYLGSNKCTPGTACNDFREFSPTTFAGTANPIINSAAAGTDPLITVAYGEGGMRFLNLSLNGNGANHGLFFYNHAHDLLVCNTSLDAFSLAIHSTGAALGNPTNIKITGNSISNSSNIAFLGGGDNFELSYNKWEGNGANAPLQHAIYLSGTSPSNVSVIGNYVHGQFGSTCLGGPFMSHGSFDSLLVKGNVISIDPSAVAPGCWGFSYGNNSNTTHPVFFRNTVISGNTVINGGNQGMTVSSCPGCIIENNVIVMDWPGGSTGLTVTTLARNATRGDDLSTANTVRNNTVWFGPNVTGTTTGIATNTEGTGHIIANNTVSSRQAGGTLNCFKHDLPLSSYAFINNNHCYATGASNWEKTRGSLAAWKTYAAASGFDTASLTGDPLFIAAGTDFTPTASSPLVGVGSATHKSLADFNGKIRPSLPAIGAFEPGAVAVPGVPTILRLIPGDGSMKVIFAIPAADGGLPILDYTVRCTAGDSTRIQVGQTSPIIVKPLVNGTRYSCSVHARNNLGVSSESSSVGGVVRRSVNVVPLSVILENPEPHK
jgi:hypothetical protein